ncbi:DUF1028 domain-containing protein [Bacillus timonensis]|nr:DUF1028 domain-containing protein [Bacillus timonensis]
MTFSIVGFDPTTKELGIAVQSKFLGVGAVVPWAKAGVGAVATQSYANTSYGPKGLGLMEKGMSASEALSTLIGEDEEKEYRQVGIVDAKGNAATFTGEKCYNWAGGITGKNFAAQGNILVDEETVKAMAATFEAANGSLAERLLTALDAGQEAGGDSRGKQSASLLIVKENGGYAGFNDRYIDLRVDDHPDPIKELIRIFHLQQLYFAPTKPENIVHIEGDVREKIEKALILHGYIEEENITEEKFYQGLTAYIHTENFEGREQEKGKIDKELLDYMTSQT